MAILISYATKHGATQQIAERIAHDVVGGRSSHHGLTSMNTLTSPVLRGAGARDRPRRENSATRTTVSVLAAVTAFAGVEHGVGEILQGNIATSGTMFIVSWPDSAPFSVLGGEPAMTAVPNLLVTGVLAIITSLAYLAFATLFVQHEHAGLILIALSVLMLMVGAGFGPPLIGMALGLTATRIHSPLTWWRAHLSVPIRRVLDLLWPWSLAAGVLAWFSLVPGVVLLGAIFGADAVPDTLLYVLILSAFAALVLTVIAAFARDLQRSPAAA